MDPLAHTLVGAGLAETGLKRWTPLATATLVIGANLPDIDAVMSLISSDTALLHRRGWTHGILALVVLPGLLAAAMRAYGRRRALPTSLPRLLALAYLAVWSHPLLDWLNTYGVRLLMPFDGRWFYGDTLFIIDPLMWLLAGAGVVVAGSLFRKRSWAVIGTLATVAMFSTRLTPWSARLVWLAGLLAIVLLRSREGGHRRSALIARFGLCTLTIYVAVMHVGSAVARRQANTWLVAQRLDATVVMAAPVPAQPFRRDVVAVADDRYLFLEVDWLTSPPVRLNEATMPRSTPDQVVTAALNAPSIRGFRNWMRFPSYEVEPRNGGYRVTIRDARYARGRNTGFGAAVIELDRDLQPLQ